MTTELINDLNFPEGPAFDNNRDIWLVEKEAGNLIYYKNGQYQRIYVGGHPNGIAIDQDGIIWFCDSQQNAIRQYVPIQQQYSTVVDSINGKPLKMPNDLCFDQHGNLLFTCPGDRLDDGSGYLCSLSTDRKLHIIHSGMYYPNGLAFSSDGHTLYIAETGSKWIWSAHWNVDDKKLEKVKQFAYVGGDVGPDGIAFDTENNLYVALYGSQKITVLNTEGLTIDEITLGYPNPTNCALDPSGIQGLIITEANNGQLLQFKTNKKGLL
ncbi:SMP-30/gluconolactonase/LRE family protein [Sphingobacterium yanglingense]|nr:SMP-30/gluconolactonase/LRE family protein [Sphingobacterium yanglingense]